jgi:hypothetical protein
MIFLLFLAPTILVWVLQIWGYLPDIQLLGVSLVNTFDILIYLWGLFCWMLLAEKFTDYAIDFWVITNKRIIESELLKLFDRRISTLELRDIEDITIENKGLLASMINFGRLEVQTAGTKNEFYMDNVANPAYIQKIMFDAKVAEEKEKQDIEKQEFEQISNRVFSEREDVKEKSFEGDLDKKTEVKNILETPLAKKPDNEFDWAYIDETQAKDLRNKTEVLDNVDAFKKDFEKALRSGE